MKKKYLTPAIYVYSLGYAAMQQTSFPFDGYLETGQRLEILEEEIIKDDDIG